MTKRIESKDKIGIVVSNRMTKTIVVKVERLTRHPRYKRFIRRSKKYKVHDEHNSCGVGDKVRIRETHPLAAEKYHTLVEIVERAKVTASEMAKEV